MSSYRGHDSETEEPPAMKGGWDFGEGLVWLVLPNAVDTQEHSARAP